MEELTLLHTKLDKLLKKYANLKEENKNLQEKVYAQNNKLRTLNKKLSDLEGQLTTTNTAEVLTSKDGKTAVRKQLDVLIGDIDKLLASLHD